MGDDTMSNDFTNKEPVTRRQAQMLHNLVMFEISCLTKEGAERLLDRAVDVAIIIIVHLGMYYDAETLSDNK